MAKLLQAGSYFHEDLEIGDTWSTGGIVVTEAHVLAFAGLSGDFFDLHMDDQYAREHGFPSRVAHGLLGLSLVDGLKNRAPVRLQAIASLGWTWDFSSPILIGDRIHAEIAVASVRPTRNPGRGIVALAFVVLNQRGETVQKGANNLLMHRGRPS
jgi:3-hydroxybutyryl-CoA dehydratase